MAELVTQIKLALPHFLGDVEDKEISTRLEAEGFSPKLAERCTLFVPLAFGRLILHPLGAKTATTYCLVDEKGKIVCGLSLMNEPVFKAAIQVGQQDINSGNWHEKLHRLIAFRSAEMHACNQLLLDNPAAEIGDIAFTEPCMLLSDYPVASKPWWRFW